MSFSRILHAPALVLMAGTLQAQTVVFHNWSEATWHAGVPAGGNTFTRVELPGLLQNPHGHPVTLHLHTAGPHVVRIWDQHGISHGCILAKVVDGVVTVKLVPDLDARGSALKMSGVHDGPGNEVHISSLQFARPGLPPEQEGPYRDARGEAAWEREAWAAPAAPAAPALPAGPGTGSRLVRRLDFSGPASPAAPPRVAEEAKDAPPQDAPAGSGSRS